MSPRRDLTLTQRLLAIAALTALTAIGARITIPLEPVPFTFQVLAVLLAGMLLGARDGALSQLAYVGLIALNLPLDARALGVAALGGRNSWLHIWIRCPWRPMGLGWIVERGRGARLATLAVRRRWALIIIYALSACAVLDASVTGMDFNAAWVAGVAPFIVFDLVKAALAASLLYAGRRLILPG